MDTSKEISTQYEWLENHLPGGMHRVDQLRPYEVDASDDGKLTYMRYHPGDRDGNCTVVKITEEDGGNNNTITRTEVAVGDWDNRANLTYYPINGTRDARDVISGFG